MLNLNKLLESEHDTMRQIANRLYWDEALAKGLNVEQVEELVKLLLELDVEIDTIEEESYQEGLETGKGYYVG